MGWCYGGYHGDAVHVETAALDRNCRRACAEIYIKDMKFYSKGEEVRVGGTRRGPRVTLCWGLSRTSFPRRAAVRRACVLYVAAPLRRDDGGNAHRSPPKVERGEGHRDVGKCKVT